MCLCLPQADAGPRLPDAGVAGDGVFVCVCVCLRPMPDIDYLMQEWPAEFEEALSSTHLPTADLDCDLATYVEIICSKCPRTTAVLLSNWVDFVSNNFVDIHVFVM